MGGKNVAWHWKNFLLQVETRNSYYLEVSYFLSIPAKVNSLFSELFLCYVLSVGRNSSFVLNISNTY